MTQQTPSAWHGITAAAPTAPPAAGPAGPAGPGDVVRRRGSRWPVAAGAVVAVAAACGGVAYATADRAGAVASASATAPSVAARGPAPAQDGDDVAAAARTPEAVLAAVDWTRYRFPNLDSGGVVGPSDLGPELSTLGQRSQELTAAGLPPATLLGTTTGVVDGRPSTLVVVRDARLANGGSGQGAGVVLYLFDAPAGVVHLRAVGAVADVDTGVNATSRFLAYSAFGVEDGQVVGYFDDAASTSVDGTAGQYHRAPFTIEPNPGLYETDSFDRTAIPDAGRLDEGRALPHTGGLDGSLVTYNARADDPTEALPPLPTQAEVDAWLRSMDDGTGD